MISAARTALRLISQATLFVLLMIAALTPAFAELGCLEDKAAHAQEAVESAPPALSVNSGEEEGQTSPVGPAAHCAFSHCAHGIPAAPPARDAGAAEVGSDYIPFLDARLLAAARDGPEHPPRA